MLITAFWSSPCVSQKLPTSQSSHIWLCFYGSLLRQRWWPTWEQRFSKPLRGQQHGEIAAVLPFMVACWWWGAEAREMAMRTERERGRVWRGAGDCPWWMGGAVSMRWAGRLWAGPDGLAGLRAAVCALQTVVGETTINTQRLLECSEKKTGETRG